MMMWPNIMGGFFGGGGLICMIFIFIFITVITLFPRVKNPKILELIPAGQLEGDHPQYSSSPISKRSNIVF